MVNIRLPKLEYKLALYALYLVFLLLLLLQGSGWKPVLYLHVFFTFILSLVYFGKQFFYIFIAPFITIIIFYESWRIKKYLRNFKLDTPSDVAIILSHSNWFKFEAWVIPNYVISDIKLLVKYLRNRKREFAFYPNANVEDVKKIMSNTRIREVFFLGHGTSHVFQLKNDDILYYCDFNDLKYQKDFVHQVHCGTPDGKSLVDYVVPEQNQPSCFLVRKSINSFDISKEFKRRIPQVTNKTA